MSRILFFKTAFFILVFSIVGAHAQTSFDTKVSDLPIVKITDNQNLSADAGSEFAAPKFINRSFKTEKSNADVPANRQQTYVRPTKEARLKRYLSDGFGVPALIGAGIGATFNQIGNNPPEWKKTVGGFGRRYASSYGTNAIENTVTFGLSEAFKLDNLYVKSTQKNFGKRLQHVLVASYTTRTPSGKRIPDFPYVIGTYTANITANSVWYPKRYGVQDGVRDGSYSLGFNFGINLLREFIFRK